MHRYVQSIEVLMLATDVLGPCLFWGCPVDVSLVCSYWKRVAGQPGFGFNVYKVDQATLDRFLNGPSPKETARNDMTFLRLSLR